MERGPGLSGLQAASNSETPCSDPLILDLIMINSWRIIVQENERMWDFRWRLNVPFHHLLSVMTLLYIPDAKYIHKAYFLFEGHFRHLYEDLILSLDEQKISDSIIRCLPSEDAFEVVEMELGFMHV